MKHTFTDVFIPGKSQKNSSAVIRPELIEKNMPFDPPAGLPVRTHARFFNLLPAPKKGLPYAAAEYDIGSKTPWGFYFFGDQRGGCAHWGGDYTP